MVPARRGTVYVMVLGISLLLAAIGVGALALARVNARAASTVGDAAEARLYAFSAIELGRLWIKQNPDWRAAYPAGVWAADRPIGSGAFTLEVVNAVNPAYPLDHAATDPVVMMGTGVKGAARQKMSVELSPRGAPLSCLEVSLIANSTITFSSAVVTTDQTIASNGSLTGTGSMISGRVEVHTTWTGGNYSPSLPVTGVAARTMPDPAALDAYIAEGSAISIASIPNVSGKKTIEKLVISPASPPYGASANAKGVYVLDCQNQAVRLRDARVVGTLVVRNPGTGFTVEKSVLWETAVANYPALLVSGNATLSYTRTALSESSLNVNFNPTGTPYQGVWDGDKVDTYPSAINGLVYVSGDLTTSADVVVNGALIAGNSISSTGKLALSYRRTWYDNPPPGFGEAAQMVPTPGSWRRVVD